MAVLVSRPTIARLGAVRSGAKQNLVAVRAARPDDKPPSSQTSTSTTTRDPIQAAKEGIPSRIDQVTSAPGSPTPVSPAPLAKTLASSWSFAGPIPETVNGRLAMLGFTAAVGAELASHMPVVQQLRAAPLAIAGTFLAIIAASAIPLLRGARTDRGVGPFSPDAEIINGRLAMVGFVALLATEAFRGGGSLF